MIRAIGLRLFCDAYSADVTTSAAAPSLIFDAFAGEREEMLEKIRSQIPRRAHVKAEAIMFEDVCSSTKCRVLLDESNVITAAREKRGGSQTADPAADDNDAFAHRLQPTRAFAESHNFCRSLVRTRPW